MDVPMPPVNSLFAGRTIFLTGGSGFVGKVVIEKFLHDVPDIKKIFVLVRAAKGKTASQRWAEAISQNVIFNRVRADCPAALEKVVPVEGDITMDEMGLSEDNLKAVLEETSVVLHCAATIRFNDTLRSAIELNIKGVERMIKLCKRMKNLECYLHCSTAYVNVDKQDNIDEKLYDVVCDPHKLIEAHGWMPDEMLEGVSSAIVKKYNNTYCFTKHVAEELVRRECVDLPTIIFRPAIIAGIWKDGIPGWADSFQGVTACALGFGTGTIPRYPCDTRNPYDVVPVDVVSNMMITCAAYRLHLTAQKDRSMPVFHCSSSQLNPLPIGHFRDLCGTFVQKYPLEKVLFSPSAGTRGSTAIEDKMHAFRQHVVGPALDSVGTLLGAGKKPFWTRTFSKVREVYGVLIPFVAKRWIFQSNGLVALIGKMQPEDRERFDFDIRRLDWNEYISDVIFGMKTFLVKDDIMSDAKLATARRKVWMHQGVELVATLFVGWLMSVLLTRDFSSRYIAVALSIGIYLTLNVGLTSTVRIGTIDSYRNRMQAALREEKNDNNNNNNNNNINCKAA